MWFSFAKVLPLPTIIAFGLLLVVVVAVFSCGSGMMPSMSAMHGESRECSSMLASTFVISHKELGVMQFLALLVLSFLLLAVWGALLVRLLIAQQYRVHILLYARSAPVRLHDYLRQQFSSGILHSQIY